MRVRSNVSEIEGASIIMLFDSILDSFVSIGVSSVVIFSSGHSLWWVTSTSSTGFWPAFSIIPHSEFRMLGNSGRVNVSLVTISDSTGFNLVRTSHLSTKQSISRFLPRVNECRILNFHFRFEVWIIFYKNHLSNQPVPCWIAQGAE